MAFEESPHHLFQPPKFSSKDRWFKNFDDALVNSDLTLNLDIAAIQSYLSFGYICGNRTLLQEIKRQPWLSEIKNNKVIFSEVPPHGMYASSFEKLSDIFFQLLLEEAREVSKDYEDIYLLLSGGLDSRIAAGVFKHLQDNGELKKAPKAVTWGLEDSRDVVYAKHIADILNFEWIHIPLQPENILENVEVCAEEMGLLHSPEMLHSMLWFKNLPKNSLVIAGSFGDSIGRAEFSNLHLLQLPQPQVVDKFNLLSNEAQEIGKSGVQRDIEELFHRSPKALPYAHREHFMQACRMRGGLCNALTVINRYAKIYQIFTSPKVFEFIWSLHPSVRGDEMYVIMFKKYMPQLAQLPWARTNKALEGKTMGAVKGLRLHYHQYTKWAKNELRTDLETLIDLDWYAQHKIFNIDNIALLRDIVQSSEVRVGRANDIWLWLAGFRIFVDNLKQKGHELNIEPFNLVKKKDVARQSNKSYREKLNNTVLNKNEFINSLSKNIRTHYRKQQTKKLKRNFTKQHPLLPIDLDSHLKY